jgi:Ca2+/Na+ antiporter
MQENIFKIRRAFLIPLWTIVVLFFVLFVQSLFIGQLWEIIVSAIFFAVLLAIAVEASERAIILTEKKLKIKRFFRQKEFDWERVTNLGIVELGKKVYFLISATRGLYFFSNVTERHAQLADLLVKKMDEERVEPQVREYLKRPVERLSLIVMSYVAVLIIAAIIIMKVLQV